MRHDKQFSIPIKDATGRNSRVFIDRFGSGDYFIEVRGTNITFEWSEQFGPLPVTRTGAGRNLAHNHPFWRAVSLWNLQGQRLEGKKAIWHEPRKPVYEIVGRQIVKVIDPGEPGHDW